MSKAKIFTTSDGQNYWFPFTLISILFFLWAFCNSMLDSMDKHFQNFLHLSKSQSAWVQFAHYLGYFLMSLPAGWLTHKLGYKKGIIAGLVIVSLGCFWFIPATSIQQFWAFLLGVCIVAMGLTFLETIANPYTTVLGDPKYAATRINLAQSFNGLGWPLGPWVGGLFFYASESAGGANAANQTLWIPYAGIAVFVLLLCVVFLWVKLPELNGEDIHHLDGSTQEISKADPNLVKKTLWGCITVMGLALSTIAIAIGGTFIQSEPVIHSLFFGTFLIVLVGGILWVNRQIPHLSSESIWSYPHFNAAPIAQFFYVAAQAGTFAFFINYVTEELPPLPDFLNAHALLGGAGGTVIRNGSLHVTDQGATKLLAYAFGVFILGRFTGASLLKKYSPQKMLSIYALVNVALHFIVFMKIGWISAMALLGSFFFMSIMYPTIFALGIHGLGEKARIASSYIVMAIMGGAIMPKAMGWVGDHHNMSTAFIVPVFCFGMVALYGFYWTKLIQKNG